MIAEQGYPDGARDLCAFSIQRVGAYAQLRLCGWAWGPYWPRLFWALEGGRAGIVTALAVAALCLGLSTLFGPSLLAAAALWAGYLVFCFVMNGKSGVVGAWLRGFRSDGSPPNSTSADDTLRASDFQSRVQTLIAAHLNPRPTERVTAGAAEG